MAHLRSYGNKCVNHNPVSDRKSTVDIRLMCERFENLSDRTKQNGTGYNSPAEARRRILSECVPVEQAKRGVNEMCTPSDVPVAPLRRNKRSSSSSVSESVAACHGSPVSQGSASSRVSVRDRMKLFEMTDCSDNTSVPKANSSPKVPLKSVGKKDPVVQVNGTDEVFLPDLPPVKPPRSMPTARLQKQESDRSKVVEIQSEIQRAIEKNNGKVLDTTSRNMNVVSTKRQTLVPPALDLKNLAGEGTKFSPEITSPTLGKSPKSVAIKSSALKSCIKQLSHTANQICDKVKNKSANIFVDLTPTTVSPPKCYGSLKRSHSEEHIYADPCDYSPVKKQSPKDGGAGLHYMCSPIVDTVAQKVQSPKAIESGRNGAIDNEHRDLKLNKASMRNVIYESFSMLRRPSPSSRKGDDVIVEGVEGDSASDVSVKDVQERIIYVKSVKKQMSVSSICIAPKLFELCLVIGISDEGPQVLFKHPQRPSKSFDYPLIPHLCFPDYHCLEKSAVYRSETFNFTLESGSDEKIFGYCHRILGWPEQKCGFCANCPIAVCLLTSVSAPVFYSKVLVEIEKHMILPIKKCMEYLMGLQKLGIPNAGASVSIPDNTEEITKRTVITRPLDFHTVSMDLTRAMQLLDVDVILKALSSLLLERRVLFLSSNTRNLLSCYKAIVSLLYPFQWQHLMIPVVPSCLLIQCCTESPYLLGVVTTDYSNILDLLSEHQLLIIDADKGLILKSCRDEDTILPRKVHRAVVGALNLSKNMTDPTEMMRDIMISEAVVHMFVEIVGHAENHLVSNDGTVVFQKEAFQKSCSSKGIQAFLLWFSESQMFETFIEEYIWRLNYKEICHSQQHTFFEKRVAEYKWEMARDGGKITKKIGKTVRNIGEKLKILKLS